LEKIKTVFIKTEVRTCLASQPDRDGSILITNTQLT